LKTTDPTQQPVSFEASLRELEETVEMLEAGDLPLEESLLLFERGVGSLKRCHAVLDQAEKRVRLLVKSANGATALEDITPVPVAPAAASASTRKKSVKQSIDLEPPTRQNSAALSDTQSLSLPPLGAGAGEGQQSQDSGQEDVGLGGSLFGVSK
jgi:exodeoxyribonuclease VII small subunit